MALRNAFRNKIVRNDSTWEIKQENLNDYKVKDVLELTKKNKDKTKDKGISLSAMRRKFLFNDDEMATAERLGHIWSELDEEDGQEYWFEREKTMETTHQMTQTKQLSTRHFPCQLEEFQAMLSASVQENTRQFPPPLENDPEIWSGVFPHTMVSARVGLLE